MSNSELDQFDDICLVSASVAHTFSLNKKKRSRC